MRETFEVFEKKMMFKCRNKMYIFDLAKDEIKNPDKLHCGLYTMEQIEEELNGSNYGYTDIIYVPFIHSSGDIEGIVNMRDRTILGDKQKRPRDFKCKIRIMYNTNCIDSIGYWFKINKYDDVYVEYFGDFLFIPKYNSKDIEKLGLEYDTIHGVMVIYDFVTDRSGKDTYDHRDFIIYDLNYKFNNYISSGKYVKGNDYSTGTGEKLKGLSCLHYKFLIYDAAKELSDNQNRMFSSIIVRNNYKICDLTKVNLDGMFYNL